MTFKKIIIIPTDTVYGIGTGLYHELGIKRIYEIKHRPLNKQIPVLFSDIKQLMDVVEITAKLIELGSKYWPGALTIICNTRRDYYDKTGEKTLAIRMPNHIELLELLDVTGPLKVTSLNESGEIPLNNRLEIENKYRHLVDDIYDFKECNYSNISSTIVDITTDELKIVRQGTIKL